MIEYLQPGELTHSLGPDHPAYEALLRNAISERKGMRVARVVALLGGRQFYGLTLLSSDGNRR